MQTLRDFIDYMVKETVAYLENTDRLKVQDVYLEDKLRRKLLLNKDITKYLNKSIIPEKKRSLARTEVNRNLTLVELQLCQIICEVHQISFTELFSRTRKIPIVDARKQLTSFMYVYMCYTYNQIAIIFGKDHSTIIHNIKAHEDLLQTNSFYCTRFAQFLDQVNNEMPDIMVRVEQTSQRFREYERLKAERVLNSYNKVKALEAKVNAV